MADFSDSFLESYFRSHNALQQQKQFDIQQALAQAQLSQTRELQTRQMDITQNQGEALNAFRDKTLKQDERRLNLSEQEAQFDKEKTLFSIKANPNVAPASYKDLMSGQGMLVGGMAVRPLSGSEQVQRDLATAKRKHDAEWQLRVDDLGKFSNAISMLGIPMDEESTQGIASFFLGGKDLADVLKQKPESMTKDQALVNGIWLESQLSQGEALRTSITNNIRDAFRDPKISNNPEKLKGVVAAVGAFNRRMESLEKAKESTAAQLRARDDAEIQKSYEALVKKMGGVSRKTDATAFNAKLWELVSSGQYRQEAVKAYVDQQRNADDRSSALDAIIERALSGQQGSQGLRYPSDK